ncbi:hypothetical protein GDI3169 [Gluconacetobacter diazotrophicus PA1 5]|uniref:Uncharacterized protein n=1 Tax=Gluconacetobacter diazotrophicus (strain ATCC 49037 / DSM 5601 / CCUG 37298 / CIP 103539 / LMG 7603 / PAl5) TaxID=272568 RepID=A9H0D9_GLUDA|nr:hypothetical protein GDI3169 [Gluconacetobacter diazotrophicus PA1 5]
MPDASIGLGSSTGPPTHANPSGYHVRVMSWAEMRLQVVPTN